MEDQKTMQNLESRRRFVLEQRHFFYFLGIGSKELSFSRTHGEQDLGSTGKYSWCGFITVFENNSQDKNILQINIHNYGILLFYITHAPASFLYCESLSPEEGKKNLIEVYMCCAMYIFYFICLCYLVLCTTQNTFGLIKNE